MKKKEEQEEEVGDLFIGKSRIVVKLLPSNKTASMPIEWFPEGRVTDHERAAKDIAGLVGKLQGKSGVVRGLTLMTDRGPDADPDESGLAKVVESAGFRTLN